MAQDTAVCGFGSINDHLNHLDSHQCSDVNCHFRQHHCDDHNCPSLGSGQLQTQYVRPVRREYCQSQAWATLTTNFGSPRLGTIGNKLDYASGQAFRLDSQCRLVVDGGAFDGQVMNVIAQGIVASSSNIFFAPAGRSPGGFAESFCVVTSDSRLNCDFNRGFPTTWIEESSIYESPTGPWWQVGRQPYAGPSFGLPLVQWCILCVSIPRRQTGPNG